MDVTTTTLEALIQRAINPQNAKVDNAAIDAFCVISSKETDGVQIASRLIATHIQSPNEKESLQALFLLDICMTRCGRTFHAEVGKFRFLNEMIKLVSPKYLGSTTPSAVRDKVLELLHKWTENYPREVKINEAYQMLKTQGVVKNETQPNVDNKNYIPKTQKAKNSLFEDEEKTKLLQELLKSKDPFELQLANRLIKSMVNDDERRIQQRNTELESAHSNIKLLSEMLDSYNPAQKSVEDVELMKELHQTCERFKPTLLRLADEMQDNEDILGQVLSINDELSQVFEKYAFKMNLMEKFSNSSDKNRNDQTSLLDFSCSEQNVSPASSNLLNEPYHATSLKSTTSPQSDMEILNDIFNSMGISTESPVLFDNNLPPCGDVMQPIQVISSKLSVLPPNLPVKINTKTKALEDLNEIGKSLLQQSLCETTKSSTSKLITRNTKLSNDTSPPPSECSVQPINFNLSIEHSEIPESENNLLADFQRNNSQEVDTDMIHNSMSTLKSEEKIGEIIESNAVTNASNLFNIKINSLADIDVTLENITPSTKAPITLIDNNNVIVTLNFADQSQRPDISIIVVTTINKNSKALTNYLFQAAIPKACKCLLQQPSRIYLPRHISFIPSEAIKQIILIANPNKIPVSFKFMLSYTMNDETYTEMGEIEDIYGG